MAARQRIRHLIALDATNVMDRLSRRQDEMVTLFSRLRDRAPLLKTVNSWFDSISFGELSTLEPGEQHAVNEFHLLLRELRWYLEFTEDMPGAVQITVTRHARLLAAGYAKMMRILAPEKAGATPVVDAVVVNAARRPRLALTDGPGPPRRAGGKEKKTRRPSPG